MKAALELLQLITEEFPPTPPAKHSLTCLGGSLVLSLYLVGSPQAVIFDPKDFSKTPAEITAEIKDLLRANQPYQVTS